MARFVLVATMVTPQALTQLRLSTPGQSYSGRSVRQSMKTASAASPCENILFFLVTVRLFLP